MSLELKEKQRQAVIEYMMDHALGREYVWGLLAECGIYRSSWHDSALIHFNEGRRDVGLRILDEIMRKCPKQYLAMQSEAMDRASKPEEEDDDGNH